MVRLSRENAASTGFTLLKSGFERPNLSYIVRRCEDKTGQVLSICKGVAGTGIVYLRHRSKCEEMAAVLKANGVSASFYHAGLGRMERSERQEAWKKGELRVVVCTNAFGMGIDKPDVRFVVHMDLPDSPEAYFQEAGRAGRDGKRSYAVLLWGPTDEKRLRQLTQTSFPSLEFTEDIYQKLHVFHEIPYEAGMGRQIRFKLDEFCRHYRLNRSQVHYAIEYLARTGHLSYCEDVDIPAQVKISVGRNDLYDIDLPEPRMIQLLETLMRRCSGIFSYPVSIDEEYVAKSQGINIPSLRQLLYSISLLHVIRYIPADNSTVLILHHGRLMPGNVNLQPEKYRFLKEKAESRTGAMIEYVSETDECRSRYLLRYFGQTETSDCGSCDVCRSKEKWKKALEAFLAGNPDAGLEEVKAFIDNPANGMGPEAMEIYRKMLD